MNRAIVKRTSKASTDKKLRKFKKILFRRLKLQKADFSLFLVPNRDMEAIRGKMALRPDFKGREADKIRREEQVGILSFPEPVGFPNPQTKAKNLGEVYLNYDFSEGDLDRLSYLLIHGLLHLLGYEHGGKRDRMEMEKLEKELFVLVNSQ